MRLLRRIGLLGLALVLCAFAPWTAQLGKDNPLVGRIYSDSGFIGGDVLNQKLATARFVILGETHDNPDHHRLQAQFLAEMVKAGRTPAVVLEMLPRSAQEKIDAYLSSADASAEGFGEALAWEKRGWPAWTMYQPILEVAIGAKLRVFAGNLDRDTMRTLARQGTEALDDAKSWGLETPLPEAQRKMLDQELIEGHCNMLPEAAIPAMRMVQRARDASMADIMMSAAKSADGAVLIAGAGHARGDFGVPYYLRQRGAERILSVSMMPVLDEESDAKTYFDARGGDENTIYVFTPRIDDKDHCAELREQMKSKKKKDG